MKTITRPFLACCFLLLSISFYAQTNEPIPLTALVFKSVQGKLEFFNNQDVQVTIQLKDESGSVQYGETHTTGLDQSSSLNVLIGFGAPFPGNDFYTLDLSKIKTYCLDIILLMDVGNIALPTIENHFGSVLDANFANMSSDAYSVGGYLFRGNPVPVDEFWTNAVNNSFLFKKESEKQIVPVQTTSFLNTNTTPSAVNGNSLTYFNLGNGSDQPIVFSNMPLDEIRSKYTLCPANIDDLEHVLEVKAPVVHRTHLIHNTAAIYAENILYDQGVGLFANAIARGVYSQATTGVLGITNGTGNGAALWGHVGNAPDAGGFKYGMFTTDNSVANAWAAAVFGSGFYTGTWSQSSDARLKKEIRSQTNGLSTILQIRPTQYQYIEDTPYALPEGIHHGFIAQEMEKVLPELVSDIIMPKSLDPASTDNSKVESYKAINYTELIPILTAAIQELNAKVEAQGMEIIRLNEALKANSKSK